MLFIPGKEERGAYASQTIFYISNSLISLVSYEPGLYIREISHRGIHIDVNGYFGHSSRAMLIVRRRD